MIAAALAGLGELLGWRGVDLAAQTHRAAIFRSNGFGLWDTQWYGGHWTLDYSVLFPPVAAATGLVITGAACAVAATWAFDTLVRAEFGGAAAVAGSICFAVGTVVQLSIGQLPFLMGEALALLSAAAAIKQRTVLAALLALATSLASPLAGAFLLLGMAGWVVANRRASRRSLLAVGACAGVPIAVTSVLFAGAGAFPFPFIDFAFELAACGVFWLLVPRDNRGLRLATVFYAIATVICFLVPSPLGGNVGRLEECLAVPLALCLTWVHRRWLLPLLAVPMLLFQWTPAWSAISDRNGRDPSTHEQYYEGLTTFLAGQVSPLGRVEVVPTKFHWETAYVSPVMSLARGGERQLDIADNPLFYGPVPLTAAAYSAWLESLGVRFVALSDAEPDYAGVAEAAVVRQGVQDLHEVWSDAHWRVYEVTGSPGIISGPVDLVRFDGGAIDLNATAAGVAVVRERWTTQWTVASGAACLAETPDHTLQVEMSRPGPVQLRIRLLGVFSAGKTCSQDGP